MRASFQLLPLPGAPEAPRTTSTAFSDRECGGGSGTPWASAPQEHDTFTRLNFLPL